MPNIHRLNPVVAALLVLLPYCSPLSARASDEDERARVLEQMKEVIIPELKFESTPIHDVVEQLSDLSRKHAPESWSRAEREKGVNIVAIFPDYEEDTEASKQAAEVAELRARADARETDIFGCDTNVVERAMDRSQRKCTLNVRAISLFDAVSTIVKVVGGKMHVDGAIVKIVHERHPEKPLIFRAFPVMPSFHDNVISISVDTSNVGDPAALPADYVGQSKVSSAQHTFEQLGIPVLFGSSVRYVRQLGKVFALNTAANLEKLEEILSELNVTPRQIVIKAQSIRFKRQDVERLIREGHAIGPALRDLFENGKGFLVACPLLVSQNGEEAKLRSVQEVIYPTKLGRTELHSLERRLEAVVPAAFETREIGGYLNVIPEIDPSGSLITLTFTFRIVGLAQPYPARTGLRSSSPGEFALPELSPRFQAYQAHGRTFLKPGSFVLVDGGTPSGENHLQYTFVRSDLVAPGPKPFPLYDRTGTASIRGYDSSSEAKLRRVDMDDVEFRHATARVVLEFLNRGLRENRHTKEFEIRLEKRGGPSATGGILDTDKAITFRLRKASALDILRVLEDYLVLRYRINVQDRSSRGPRIVNRTYVVMPNFAEVCSVYYDIGRRSESGNLIDIGDDFEFEHGENSPQEVFRALGVPFGLGESLRYVRQLGKIFVSATPQNHERIERILVELGVTPAQVEIQGIWIDFPAKLISRLSRNGDLSVSTLIDLYRSGKGRIVCAPTILAKNGEEAEVKSVDEVIYPTEYTKGRGTNSVPGVVYPTEFETREAGVLLNVIPEVSPDGSLITVTCTPRIVWEPEWAAFRFPVVRDGEVTRMIEFRHPWFPVNDVQTRLMLYDGEMLPMGGGFLNHERNAYRYVFMTARLIDAEGMQVRKRSPKEDER